MSEDLTEKVVNTIAKVFNVEPQKITLELEKEDFESWDSIGHLQLVMNLESDFGVKFRIEEINIINSVKDCVDLVSTYSK